jgi:hypothetical protein
MRCLPSSAASPKGLRLAKRVRRFDQWLGTAERSAVVDRESDKIEAVIAELTVLGANPRR